jgi:hypothetical protein
MRKREREERNFVVREENFKHKSTLRKKMLLRFHEFSFLPPTSLFVVALFSFTYLEVTFLSLIQIISCYYYYYISHYIIANASYSHSHWSFNPYHDRDDVLTHPQVNFAILTAFSLYFVFRGKTTIWWNNFLCVLAWMCLWVSFHNSMMKKN